MTENIRVNGIVLSSMDIAEYDRRIVILTDYLGKVSAFARGARRTGSRFLGGTQPLSFCTFDLYPGKNSYSVSALELKEYFADELKDIEDLYTGMYFLEFADYYGREGLESSEMLSLVYYGLRALKKKVIDRELVRRIFELKMLVINGEYPDFFRCGICQQDSSDGFYDSGRHMMVCSSCSSSTLDEHKLEPAALYALKYIVSTPVQKVFSFKVTKPVMDQIEFVVEDSIKYRVDGKFNSLEFLKILY